jgi:hypothetical protein
VGLIPFLLRFTRVLEHPPWKKCVQDRSRTTKIQLLNDLKTGASRAFDRLSPVVVGGGQFLTLTAAEEW